MSPAEEHLGSPFILVMQTTNDTEKYIASMLIQQVYKSSHEEHPRRKIHRGEMKFDQYLPLKLQFSKLFEVEDQINPVLLIYDEPADRQQFWWPSKWAIFEV